METKPFDGSYRVVEPLSITVGIQATAMKAPFALHRKVRETFECVSASISHASTATTDNRDTVRL